MQYMDRIDFLIWLIKSELAGNWVMQVPTMKEILLKMQGMHNLYTKYIYVYLGAYD